MNSIIQLKTELNNADDLAVQRNGYFNPKIKAAMVTYRGDEKRGTHRQQIFDSVTVPHHPRTHRETSCNRKRIRSWCVLLCAIKHGL